MPTKTELKIDWASYASASFACKKWHYSSCTPKSKQIWLGVWEEGKFIGVISFGRSSTRYLGDAYGLKTTECAELTRVALDRHRTPVSRMLAICFRMVKKQSPGIRLIVSLADPGQDHIGGIYQAGGWVYVGRSSAMTQYLYRQKWRNDTPLMRALKTNPSLKNSLPRRTIEGKHKYLMPLDPEIRSKIDFLKKPYPKRASGVVATRPLIQAGEGGAEPTDALQFLEGSDHG
jgi:hypothetical protein